MKILFKVVLTLVCSWNIQGSLLDEKINWTNVKFDNKYQEPKFLKRIQESRIEGGSYVNCQSKKYFTFQVRLLSQDFYNRESFQLCGGSLISQSLVITAAHCVRNFDQSSGKYVEAAETLMHFGITSIAEMDLPQTVKRMAAKYLVHPRWNPFHPEIIFDIAIIVLNAPIIPNETIKPIALPTEQFCDVYENVHPVVVSGWGLQNETSTPDKLKYVAVNVQSTRVCGRFWDKLFDAQSMICAIGPNNEGTCQGDSGGPMMYINQKGEQILIGLTSYGSSSGCKTTAPRVSTCIGKYLDWIEFIKKQYN